MTANRLVPIDQACGELADLANASLAQADLKSDIEALEKGIEWEGHGDFRGTHRWHEACKPARIRRVLDALGDAYGELHEYESNTVPSLELRAEMAEAKLSKALELLKESRNAYGLGRELPAQWGHVEKIDAFLKEVQG